MKKALQIGAGIIIGLMAISLFLGDDEDNAPPNDQTAAQDDASEEASADCLHVHPVLLESIGDGIKKKTKAKIVGHGFAVRSDDYKKVWMVAAELDGPGLEGDGDIAVWGTNEDPTKASSSGLILQANGMAEQFSVWGAAAQPGSSADLNPTDHGVAEAAECLPG